AGREARREGEAEPEEERAGEHGGEGRVKGRRLARSAGHGGAGASAARRRRNQKAGTRGDRGGSARQYGSSPLRRPHLYLDFLTFTCEPGTALPALLWSSPRPSIRRERAARHAAGRPPCQTHGPAADSGALSSPCC